MRSVIRSLASGLALCLGATGAGAVVLGATNTFEDGGRNGWASGAANLSQPSNVASGGPGGTDDNYLLVTATGSSGPGGKLVVIAGPQWTGNYVAAGVSALTMDLNNLGAADLSLRLVLEGTGVNTAISSNAVVLPSGSGWMRVTFALDPALLTAPPLQSPPAETLAAVSRLRLFHGTQAAFPPQNVVAQLGMDNVTPCPSRPRGSCWPAGCLP